MRRLIHLPDDRLRREMASPANPRPTMGRHKKSLSCAALFPATITPNSSMSPSVGIRQHQQLSVQQGLRNITTTPAVTPSHWHGTAPRTPNSYQETKTMMQWQLQHSPSHHQHQHHQHRRNMSVGGAEEKSHGSLWTAPTAASSFEVQSLKLELVPSTVHARRRSAMVQELRSMWNKVVARDGRTSQLPRRLKSASYASGCLT